MGDDDHDSEIPIAMDEQDESIVKAITDCIKEGNKATQTLCSAGFTEIKAMIENFQNRTSGINIDEEDLGDYVFVEPVAQGAFGTVCTYKHKETQEIYAVKQIHSTKNELTKETAREITFLCDMKHENIVRLHQVLCRPDGVFLIFEYVPYDLNECIQHKRFINSDVIKVYLKQILSAVKHLHAQNVMHRDLKPENILVESESKIKLADLGSARGWFEDVKLTPEVTTLLYRAPELLMGAEEYTTAIDMWSIGCIFAEMSEFKPLLAEDYFEELSGREVLFRIFNKLGTPTEEGWPGVSNLPKFPKEFPVFTTEFSEIAPNLDGNGRDLLMKFLSLDPRKRITAMEALKHPYLAVAAV